MENRWFSRQSGAVAIMKKSHRGPRCRFPLITPHLRQVLCCIFNEMKSGATAFFSHFAFLHPAGPSVGDDKLQFGERSSEIFTRASSKPPNQWLNDIFINQWDVADRRKTNCSLAGRLACWLLEQVMIFCHLAQFTAKLPVSSHFHPVVILQWAQRYIQGGAVAA